MIELGMILLTVCCSFDGEDLGGEVSGGEDSVGQPTLDDAAYLMPFARR
jgi:hypothetical protein